MRLKIYIIMIYNNVIRLSLSSTMTNSDEYLTYLRRIAKSQDQVMLTLQEQGQTLANINSKLSPPASVAPSGQLVLSSAPPSPPPPPSGSPTPPQGTWGTSLSLAIATVQHRGNSAPSSQVYYVEIPPFRLH